jgi:hypothetical protein
MLARQSGPPTDQVGRVWAGRHMVKRTGLGYECTVCGARLDCGVDAKPQVVIVQSGGKPTVRSVLVDGVEIHRCRDRDLAAGDAAVPQ